MSAQPPDTPQPPPSLWDAIPEIVKKLQNEFLLASSWATRLETGYSFGKDPKGFQNP